MANSIIVIVASEVMVQHDVMPMACPTAGLPLALSSDASTAVPLTPRPPRAHPFSAGS